MQLLEGVPFVWCDEPKLIERWNTRLNIELVECMFEPSKGPPYGKNSSPFATFFMFRRKYIMCLDQFAQSFFLIYWNGAPINLGDLAFFPRKNTKVIVPFEKNSFRFNGWPILELFHYLNNPFRHLVQGPYPPVPLLETRFLLQHCYSCFLLRWK
jgi:hypothetical protein